MSIMKNALVYVTNHKQVVQEEIDNALSQHQGVTRTSHSLKGKGMVFVDYECDEVSMEVLINDLKNSGMTARVIGL